MRKLLPMMALRVAGSDCECSSLRIETMNASLGIAGGEPAKAILVAIVDRRRLEHDVSILMAAVGGPPPWGGVAPRCYHPLHVMMPPPLGLLIFFYASVSAALGTVS